MSDEKFTPGPWQLMPFDGHDDPEAFMGCIASGSGIIYSGPFSFKSLKGEANAALIASAPDLYEQLSDLVSLAELDRDADEVGTDMYTVLMLSREVLAKARGEGGGA